MREIVERHRREPTYRPIVVIQDATLAQVAAVTARRLDFELPDVLVAGSADAAVPVRIARRASDSATSARPAKNRSTTAALQPGTIVGQTGVEQVYNTLLMGEDGARRVVVNSIGREIARSTRAAGRGTPRRS